MALTDSATFIPGTGHIFLGTVGTATKWTLSNLTTYVSAGTVPATWTELGHTSADDILAPGQDGGDTEVKASWQNTALREVTTESAVDYFVIPSLQLIDNTVLNLYYGGGDATVANEFAVPDTAVAVEKACTIVMIDGTTPVACYMPKATIRREDAMEFDRSEFTTVPLRFTALKYSTLYRIYWISDALGA